MWLHKGLHLPIWSWVSLGITFVLLMTVLIVGIVVVTNEHDVSDPSVPTAVDAIRGPAVSQFRFASPTAPPTHTPSPTLTPTITLPLATAIDTATFVVVSTDSVAIVDCPPPAGWEQIRVEAGDTLFAFQLGATRAGNPATVDEIMAANCLGNTLLQIGQILWLPAGADKEAPSSAPVVTPLPPDIPRVATCNGCTITIQAGWRLEQIAEAIDRAPVAFSGADFLAVTGRGAALPPRDFLASVPAGSGLEGFMFPGVYPLTNDTTAAQFRDMILDAFAVNAAGIVAPGMTLYDTVKLASIIQKESGHPEEQRLVSSVFHNRINAGKGLAATVTIAYALGRPGNWYFYTYPGITNVDSPYNTNLYRGLPPTPISNPGLSALAAAANPAQTNFQYFTANCRGPGNAYAETYEQHLANVECR